MVGYVVRSSCAILYAIIQQEPHHLCSDTCMQVICCASAAECNIYVILELHHQFSLCDCCMAPPEFQYQICYRPVFHLSSHSFRNFTVYMCGIEHLGNTVCPSAQMSMRHFTSSVHQVHP